MKVERSLCKFVYVQYSPVYEYIDLELYGYQRLLFNIHLAPSIY